MPDLFIGDLMRGPLTHDVPDTRYQRGDQREQRRDIHLRDGDLPAGPPMFSATVPAYARSSADEIQQQSICYRTVGECAKSLAGPVF